MTALSPRTLERKRRALRGVRKERTSPAAAQRHLQMLVDSGLSLIVIAQAAGLNHSTVVRLRSEGRQYVTVDCERAILAVRPRRELLAATRTLPGIGARRRVEALVALGWTYEDIARAAGLHNRQVGRVVQREMMVLKSTHDALCEAYRLLGGYRGSSANSRRIALARGYLPPAAWDDDDLDRPDGAPSNPAVDRAGEASHRLDEFEMLVNAGVRVGDAILRIGVSQRALERAAWRSGRMETGRLLARKIEGAS